jgi:hypothetical protein
VKTVVLRKKNVRYRYGIRGNWKGMEAESKKTNVKNKIPDLILYEGGIPILPIRKLFPLLFLCTGGRKRRASFF